MYLHTSMFFVMFFWRVHGECEKITAQRTIDHVKEINHAYVYVC